ncbi:MAG: hypothetical protein WD491_12695 [Balneolales bacterium]
MRYVNSFIGLVLIMVLAVGCGDRENGEETFDGETQPPPAEQDQTATQGEQPQQEFVDQMETRLDQAEEELDRVRQNAGTAGEGQQGTEQFDQIEERIDNTRDQLEELEGTESENWEQMSQDIMNNINNIEEDIQTLVGGGGGS